jgi:hypothetical protein
MSCIDTSSNNPVNRRTVLEVHKLLFLLHALFLLYIMVIISTNYSISYIKDSSVDEYSYYHKAYAATNANTMVQSHLK